MTLTDPAPGTAPGATRRHRAAPFARCLGVAAALVASLFPMASPVAAATASAATGGSAISADTAAAGGSGAWTALTGPTIVEAGAGQVGAGTIVLTVPAGFELDPSSGAVAASGVSCAGLTMSALSVTGTAATTTSSGGSTGPCTVTWSGLRVRPTAGAPRASGSLVRGGTAAITGIASGAALGALAEVAGAPAQLAFTSSPAGGTGGVSFATQPVVAVRDQFGNGVTVATPVVGLAISAGSGTAGATLACSGGTSKTAVAGVSTFSGCKVDLVGTGYTLTATSAGLASAVSAAFPITVGAASQAAFSVPPGGGTGGLAWATQPVVRLLDAGGNPTTATTSVTLAIVAGTGTAGAALACTGGLAKAAVAGVATYAGCVIDRAGTGYQLRATGSGLVAATSTPFAVTTGPAAKVRFATPPSGGTAGAPFGTAPVVAIADAGGNTVPGATDPVTLAIGTNPGGGTLACTGGLTAPAADGSAAFAGCLIERSGTGYTLVASAPGLAGATSPAFAVTAAGAAQLVVGTAPGGGTGGVAFPVQPLIRVQDAYGNTAASTATVTLALEPGSGTPGAVLSCAGGLAKAAVAGVATFSGCKVDLAGAGYRLVATSPGLAPVTTGAFGVTVGPAAQLVMTTSPVAGTGGTAFGVQPVVEVRDAGGNLVAGSSLAVTLAVTTGTGTPGAVVACSPTLVATAVAGVATFAGCRIDRAGSGYTLKATGSGVSPATGTPFAVTVGPAARLAFTVVPGGITAGVPFAAQPVIAVADAGGNTVASAEDTISLAIASGTGTAGATLACTGSQSRTAVSGVATFAGCTVDRAGSGYALTASASGLTSATAGAFAVAAAAASRLAFVAQPGGGTGGTAWPTQPSVRIVDAFGNAAPGSATVAIAVSPGSGGGTLACTGGQAKVTASGLATFAGCRVDLAGDDYTLTATATGLAAATSTTFDIVPGPTVSIAFTGQPGGGTATLPWSAQPRVALLDAGGNVATGASASVTLAIATGTAGASLSCTGGLTGATTAGIVDFEGCALDRSGVGYTLTAGATGLPSAVSAPFAVTAGLPVRLGFTAQPGGGTGGLPWATQPAVSLQDAGGNTVTTSGLVVTLALTRNDAGGTFACNGGMTRTTVSGVATFTGCTIDRTGTGYEVTASLAGGGATDAVSPPFNVVTGPPARLAFETPPGGGTGGTAWAVQPVVVVADAGGNATTGTPTVALALEAGAGTPGAALACTGSTSRPAVAGRAAFTGCAVDRSGTGYLLRASAAGLVSGLSAAFDIGAGPAAQLAFGAQPSGGTAGGNWATQPVVTLLDAGGNPADGAGTAVTLDLAANPGGATLACSGGTTVMSSGGAASFAGCSLDRAASGYTLRAAAAGLAAATSATFGITAAAPARLAFSAVPAGGSGGSPFTTQPAVRVEDAWGNPASGAGTQVTLAMAANPSGGSLTCNGSTTHGTAAGLATFSGCAIDLVGTAYAIVATAPGLAGAVTPAFDVTPGPPARLEFALQPSGGTGGSAWASQPVVAVRDAGGNPTGAAIPVTLALGSNPGSGTLACATGLALVTVDGMAAFGGCAVDRAADGYTLVVASPGLASSTSAAFGVTVGAPTRLGFAVQPSGGAAGSTWSTQPVVAIQDAGGNPVPGASVVVSLAPAPGAAGALSCAGGTSVAAVDGSAAFAGCAWTLIGGGHTVQAIAGGLAPATSQPFTVTVGTPARLRFGTAPSGATGGSPFAQQPVIEVTDAWDNPVTVSSTAVTLSVQPNLADGALACNGGPVRTTSAGLATFTGCSIDRAGSAYRLVATAAGLVDAVSPPLDVVPGPAAQLAFAVDPGAGMGGSPVGTQPVVALLDAGGNLAATGGGAVTLAITTGTGTPGAQLLCTGGNPVMPSGGLAAFVGCSVDRVGSGYSLTASRAGFAPVASGTFDVVAGPAAALVFTTGPGGGTGGAPWSTQPVVAIVDAGGNPVTGAVPVTLGLGANPTGAALACAGGSTVGAVAGVATFAGCAIDRAGAGYALRATSPGLVAASGPAFAIVAGAAARTGFATAPANGPADAAFAVQPTVTLYDAGGNITPAVTPVTLTIATGTGTPGATLTCPGGTTRAAADGLAAFDGCAIDRAGTGYRLVASGPGLGPSTSAPFDLTAPAAVLTVTASSPIIVSGTTLTLRASFLKLGAARPVAFQASTDGSTWTALATVTANGDGVATYALRPSLNRRYRAVFLGDATLGPGTAAAVEVRVRQVVRLSPTAGSDYRTVPRGRAITFTATVAPWTAGRPRATVTFTVWRRTAAGWKPVSSSSVVANLLAKATFRYTFRTSGRWSVTAKAAATTVVVGSLASNRSLIRVP